MRAKVQELMRQIPDHWKATALLQGFGLMKVPLLFSVRPRVLAIDDHQAVVKIPLNRWTKNHLSSMYFGALAMGADCVVGILALHHIQKSSAKVHLSFKDFKADFLKRPESDVLFVCKEGEAIGKFVSAIVDTGERGNLAVEAFAALASAPEQPVAKFTLTLSLKRKS